MRPAPALARPPRARADSARLAPAALLDHTLDFPLPDSPSTLTPTELVLVQFNRRCTSLDWADDAAQLFLSRARAAQADDEGAEAQEYIVRRCEMVCDGGAWVDEQGVTLQVEPDALVVGRAGEVLFKIDPCAMTGTRRASSLALSTFSLYAG